MASLTDKRHTRRRGSIAALVLALALLVVSAPGGNAAAPRGGGVGPPAPGGGGGSSDVFSGQGMWIWYLSQSSHGKVGSIIRRAKDSGVHTLFVKSADGTGLWSQFSSSLVRKLHSAHMKVCAWQFVYGTHPTGEAVAGAKAKTQGADCMVIDAESSYEGRYAAASTYVKELRKRVGNRYPIALAGFPYVDYHPAFPYSVFLGPGGAQENMPQLYWHTIGTTVAGGYSHTYEYNRVYQAPIAPVGQTYDNPPPRDLTLFRRYARAYRMKGLSWWVWQSTDTTAWSRIGAGSLKPIPPVDTSKLYPTLGRGYAGDLVVWAQEHLFGAGLHVRVSGKLNFETSQALTKFQKRNGLRRTGILDAATWKRLLTVDPKPVNWARRHHKSDASRAPASASIPAVRDEIPDMPGAAAR